VFISYESNHDETFKPMMVYEFATLFAGDDNEEIVLSNRQYSSS
jgi:hypothetical protein